MELLLAGYAFAPVTGMQVPAATISYHSYGDVLLYPEGYKAVTDSQGPRCLLDPTFPKAFCFNPDFQHYRYLFGDTHSPLWSDPGAGGARYRRDHGQVLSYLTVGDVGLQGNYAAAGQRAMTVIPELPNSYYDFYIESQGNPDDIIHNVADDQQEVLERLLAAAPGITSTDPNYAHGPVNLGRIGSGIMSREYHSDVADPADVRAIFLKPVWHRSNTGALKGVIGQTQVTYTAGRPGASYDLFYLPMSSFGLNPLCLPCEIITRIPGHDIQTGDLIPHPCTTCVDLCSATRLQVSGSWGLFQGRRGSGGAKDCWWEPTTGSGSITYPAASPSWLSQASHCHFTLAMIHKTGVMTSLVVERERSNGTWEQVYGLPFVEPYYAGTPLLDDYLYSLAFEANAELPTRVPAFRIRSSNFTGQAGDVKIFDPVVYCRLGSRP